MPATPTPTAGSAELSDAKLEELWNRTFSTNNPFCPCNLKTFTKTARAVEAEIRRAATGAEPVADERESFEQHFAARPEQMHPVAWESWQARAALSPQPSQAAAEPVAYGGIAPADGMYWAYWHNSTEWTISQFHAGYQFAETTRWAGPILPPDSAQPSPVAQGAEPSTALTALRELVALKELKDSIERWVRDDATGHQWPQMQPYERRMAACDEYKRRKPLAWAAARAALAATAPAQPKDADSGHVPSSVDSVESPRETLPLANAEELLPHAYLFAKVAMVMPLFEEARDALTALTTLQCKTHRISLTLADRMDIAGTYSIEDWQEHHAAAQAPLSGSVLTDAPPNEQKQGTGSA